MTIGLKRWCYKWLPIIFGCHCRDDRSFHWKGMKFPICARCTGMLVGTLVVLILGWWLLPSFPMGVLMMMPLIVDGTVQMRTSYESTNIRRFLTGILFGYGLPSAMIRSMIFSYHLGYGLTH